MSERHCEHGCLKEGRCPVCGAGAAKKPKRRSVYEDRPLDEAASEEWRAEQLRAIGIPTGWRRLDEFLRGRG